MKSKIRVMQLVWCFNTGGAERMVTNFHNYFCGDEEVEMLTLSFTPQKGDLYEAQLIGDNTVIYIPQFWGNRLPGIIAKVARRLFFHAFRKKWLLQQIQDFSPDIIHIHLANLAVELYDFCADLPKSIKVIYHLHSMPEAIDPKWRSVIRHAVKKGVYHPVCVTELQRKSAAKYYNVPMDAPIIYNGIDEHKFLNCTISEEEIHHIKSEFDIADDALVVGCVGRGAPIKNYPLLACAASVLAEKRPTVLLVVGDIPTELKCEMQNLIGGAKMVFAGLRSDTECLYRIMDVFALGSFYESSSIVTVEAQLSGVPAVISDRISDEVIISDSVSKLSPEADATLWAEEIERMAGKKVELRNQERFDFANSVEKLRNVYRQMKTESAS